MAKTSYRKADMSRAAIYARVSDKSQDAEDKTSISEQISDMEAHCERRGLTIVARYQEVSRGWSKKRPEFQRMLADGRQGRFDTIVCWKSDRLSRGMYPAAALMEVIEAHRINIEAVMDAIDLKTFGLMAAVGKIELDNFRERSSMGKRGTAKQGRIPIGNIKRNGKVYKYAMNPPRRYYRCYGYQQMRLQCRPKPMIRAERLERLVWNEIRKVLENPGLIIAGIESMSSQEDGGGLAEEIALAERDLQNVQMEEDRAIRLYVSGKITEDQLDHQRKFITERLEMLRARLAGYRS